MTKIHLCENFERQLAGQGFEDALRKKIEDLAQRKEWKSNKLQSFLSEKFFVLDINKLTKALFEKRTIQGEDVYFAREIISRTKEHFWATVDYPRIKNGYWEYKNTLSENEINNYLKIEAQNNSAKRKEKKDLPFELKAWLADFKISIKQDIYETENWVNYALLDNKSNGMDSHDQNDFCRLIKSIYEDDFSALEITKLFEKEFLTIFQAKHKIYEVVVIYTFFEIENRKLLLLFNGANYKKQKEHWENALKDAEKVSIDTLVNYDTIAKNAVRAYPKWLLNNIDEWRSVQKSSETSNLSLLSEQLTYLSKFKFPAYINAQAGSGKSTILYYLFANIYWLKSAGVAVKNLIFLTENATLLKEFTIPAIKSLLSNNADFQGLSPDHLIAVDDYFSTFRDYLWNLLDEDAKENFELEKYLDFSTFKNKYENEKNFHQKQKYTAEEAWFVISTYIRGNDAKKDILIYDEIKPAPNEFSSDIFEGILRDVYTNFYKKILDEGYWDKIKIIRYIYENVEISDKFSVVFCDEAQDFSRVGLRFIMQQSEFLEFNLAQDESVPIVFAGDHTQTVNPTGFRVAQTKEIFFHELNNKVDEKAYMPEYNYRSAEAVVKLANFVQYYRMKKLSIEIQKPQKAKRPAPIENYTQNVFLNYGEIIDSQPLKMKLFHKAFILPIDANEKENFLKKSNFLWDEEKNQAYFPNTKTAIEAKGVDYKQVAIYGFGDFYLEKFKEFSWENTKEERGLFQEKYFFNKLYVAITRAQDELIIIDSDFAKAHFWDKLLAMSSFSEEWKDLKAQNTNLIVAGGDIIPSVKDDEIENAQKDKQRAIAERNANALYLLSTRFYRLDDKKQYLECAGMSEELKENWAQAATFYEKLSPNASFLEQASNCYFRAKSWEDLLRISPSMLKTDFHAVRYALASMMSNPVNSLQISVLYEKKAVLRNLIHNLTWKNSIIEALLKIASTANSNKILLKDLTEILKDILNPATDFEYYKAFIAIQFEANNYETAKELWDLIGEGNKLKPAKEYIEARLKICERNGDLEGKIIALHDLLKYNLSLDEKIKIESNIITVFQGEDFREKNDIGVILAAYSAFLHQKEIEKSLLVLAQKAELLASEEWYILPEFYLEILQNDRIISPLTEFVLERWAKNTFKSPYKSENWLEELNQQYQIFAKNYQMPFLPFSDDDLEKMSNLPEQIIKLPSEHFKNMTIRNFRRFKDLELKNLGQFNLIVGDNNVGKTSVLEALLFTPDAKEFTTRLAYCYAERSNSFDFKSFKHDFLQDYLLAGQTENRLSFSLREQRNRWDYDFSGDLIDIDLLTKLTHKNAVNNPFVPYGKGFGNELADIYFTQIEDNSDEIADAFIENMKIFIPKITKIIANQKTGEIKIREKGTDTRSPLHQYGEGANKLFRILLQMTLQKNKRIMIDEIDSGIHFSRYPFFWKVILEVAAKNNIQIFATTHNLECIQYFKEVLEEDEFEKMKLNSRVITLRELSDKNIKAYTRTFEEFNYAMEKEFEIRGGMQ